MRLKYIIIIFLTVSLNLGYSQNLISVLRRAVVCLGTINVKKSKDKPDKETFLPRGSGILMYLKGSGGSPILCIVTAKHVVENKKRNEYPASLQMRLSTNDTLPFDKYLGTRITLKVNGKNLWFAHPDSSVDLACIPLIKKVSMADYPAGIEVFPYRLIGNNDKDIYDGAQVYVLGYPGFAGSEVLVKSLLRQGIISWTNPIDPDKSKFLIDCNIFPGNSGGPVFTAPFGLGDKALIKNARDIKFTGIVSQVYFEITKAVDSTSLNDVRDHENKKIYSLQKTALGVVEPASRVVELLEYVDSHLFSHE
jgi:hypothetical protein